MQPTLVTMLMFHCYCYDNLELSIFLLFTLALQLTQCITLIQHTYFLYPAFLHCFKCTLVVSLDLVNTLNFYTLLSSKILKY